MPAPFGPVRAIRSGPRTMSSASVDTEGASSVEGAAGVPGAGDVGDAGCQRVPSRPVTVSTVRPAGTAVPGRSTRISASSRTACSASSSRPRAASSRSECSPRDRPAVSCAARLRAYATILGRPPEAATLRPIRSRLACLTCASTRSRCSRLTSAAAAVTRAPGRRLLRCEQLLVRVQVAAVHADLAAGQVGDLVHQGEQLAVVADDHHHPGPGRHRVVQPLARVQVQVVGRLVQQQDVRAAQEQRGQRDTDGLAAGQPLHPVVETDPVSEAQAVQPGAGALLDVPVVPDHREDVLSRLARLDGVQRVPGGGDAEQARTRAGAVPRVMACGR